MYWSEPLSKANADRHNQRYAAACHQRLLQHADSRWDELASHAVRHSDTAAYETPNQYVRVLRWMEIPSPKTAGDGRTALRTTEEPQRQTMGLQYQHLRWKTGRP